MFSFRFSSLKESFHAHTDGPIPSLNDRWPLIEILSPSNTTTLVSSPVRYVVDTVPARWIVKPTGTGQPTNFSCITPIPPYSIFYFEDPSEVFSQYPGLMIFMDIVDLVKEDRVTFARFQAWHVAYPAIVRMSGELILEAALVDVPVAAVARTAFRVMGWLPFTLLRAIVRERF